MGKETWTAQEAYQDLSWVHEELSQSARVLREVRPSNSGPPFDALAAIPPEQQLALLQALRLDLTDGRGFFVVRGLVQPPVTPERARTAIQHAGQLLGSLEPQNRSQDLVVNMLADADPDSDDPSLRPFKTAGAQSLHSDSADAVGLLGVRPAFQGGDLRIACSLAVVAELRRVRPDLSELLEKPYPYDLYDQQGPSDDPWFTWPIWSTQGGRESVFYIRFTIESSQRHPRCPRLTERDIELFEEIDALASSEQFAVEVHLGPGDLLVARNRSVFHGREAFQDHPQPGRKRLNLRVWLSLSTR